MRFSNLSTFANYARVRLKQMSAECCPRLRFLGRNLPRLLSDSQYTPVVVKECEDADEFLEQLSSRGPIFGGTEASGSRPDLGDSIDVLFYRIRLPRSCARNLMWRLRQEGVNATVYPGYKGVVQTLPEESL